MASDLGLHCLSVTILGLSWLKWVKPQYQVCLNLTEEKHIINIVLWSNNYSVSCQGGVPRSQDHMRYSHQGWSQDHMRHLHQGWSQDHMHQGWSWDLGCIWFTRIRNRIPNHDFVIINMFLSLYKHHASILWFKMYANYLIHLVVFPTLGFIWGLSIMAVCLHYNRPTIQLDFIRNFKTPKIWRFIVIFISICTYVKCVVKCFYSVQYLITLFTPKQNISALIFSHCCHLEFTWLTLKQESGMIHLIHYHVSVSHK